MNRTTAGPLTMFAVALCAACSSNAAFGQGPVGHPPGIQPKTFESAEAAAKALIDAASKNDKSLNLVNDTLQNQLINEVQSEFLIH